MPVTRLALLACRGNHLSVRIDLCIRHLHVQIPIELIVDIVFESIRRFVQVILGEPEVTQIRLPEPVPPQQTQPLSTSLLRETQSRSRFLQEVQLA